MFCRNCGTRLNEGAAFCPSCGTQIKQTSINNYSSQPNSPSTIGQPIITNNVKIGTVPKKKKNKLIIIVVALILAVGLVVTGTIIVTKKVKEIKISHSIEKGVNSLKEKNFADAKKFYEEAISTDENKEETYINIKDEYIEVGRLDDAYSIIKIALANEVNTTAMEDVLKGIVKKFPVTTLNVTIKLNDKYSLPLDAVLKLNNEEEIKAAVDWNKPSVSTDKAGTFEYKGTASEYGRPVKLVLTVLPGITSIKDIEANVTQGDQYTLPIEVSAIMSDNSEASVKVIWNVTSVDTSYPGVQNFIGTVEGYSSKVNLKLTVNEKKVISNRRIGRYQNVYDQDGKRYLALDEIEWYTGDKALEEAQKDGQSEVMNDYYTRNPDNTITAYELSPNATIRLIEFNDAGVGLKDVTYDYFMVSLAAGTVYNGLFWVELDGNVITAIEEQYTP